MAGETGRPKGNGQPPSESTPARSVAEITSDITAERAALENAFAGLQRDVEETVEQVRRQVTAAGRKALVVGPALGVVAGGLVAAVVLLSRRRDGGD